jgi:D-lactate dehydrogenase (cytochrome)
LVAVGQRRIAEALEHGIGLGKRQQLIAEFGQPVVNLMRELKQAMDPKGILNPGKIFESLP